MGTAGSVRQLYRLRAVAFACMQEYDKSLGAGVRPMAQPNPGLRALWPCERRSYYRPVKHGTTSTSKKRTGKVGFRASFSTAFFVHVLMVIMLDVDRNTCLIKPSLPAALPTPTTHVTLFTGASVAPDATAAAACEHSGRGEGDRAAAVVHRRLVSQGLCAVSQKAILRGGVCTNPQVTTSPHCVCSPSQQQTSLSCRSNAVCRGRPPRSRVRIARAAGRYGSTAMGLRTPHRRRLSTHT